jgi:hypothetical protein
MGRSQPVARIADEHGGGIKARMPVDGGEFHLAENDRLAYRLADYSITISIPCQISGPAQKVLFQGLRSSSLFRAKSIITITAFVLGYRWENGTAAVGGDQVRFTLLLV